MSRTRARTTPIPPKPEGFSCHYAGIDRTLAVDCPARRPQRAQLVAAVAWSWSPANDRDDTYHLSTNKSRSHWILWQSTIDRMTGDPQPAVPFAFGCRHGVTAAVAAPHLLIAGWRGELAQWVEWECDLDRFHDVTEAGLLNKRAMMVVADVVWPEHDSASAGEP